MAKMPPYLCIGLPHRLPIPEECTARYLTGKGCGAGQAPPIRQAQHPHPDCRPTALTVACESSASQRRPARADGAAHETRSSVGFGRMA